MNNKKIISVVSLAATFLLPLRVYATDLTSIPTTETTDNYFYFIQPYDEFGNYNEKQVNYGIFAPQEVGSEIGIFDIVDLKRNCSRSDENCYSFQRFWEEYKNIIDNGNVKKSVYGKECNIAFTQETKGNKKINYFTHGCYKDGTSSEIKGGALTINTGYNSLGMACSSVKRGADVSLASDDVYDYLELKIVRDKLAHSDLTFHQELNLNSSISNCGFTSEQEVAPYPYKESSEDYVYKFRSPVLAKYTYTKTTYDCPYTMYVDKTTCNNSSKILQSCARKTIETTNAQADINYEQTGVITNLLSPTKIYQGGGVSLGFIYQNTIKWNFVDGSLYKKGLNEYEAKERITNEIRNSLIKSTDQFTNELKNNIELSFNGISNSYINKIKNELQINCQRTGEVREGQTLTTTCTIFMPETKLKYGIGTIDKVVGSSSDGITNKIYTQLKYTGKSHLYAKISKLNMLKVDDNNEWSISFGDINDGSCDIDVEERLYNSGVSNKAKYKFIYRPISINNPFPNRNAGANWYEWWSNPYNKERLNRSYNDDSSLQYQIELNPSSIKSIKQSNTMRDYYEWDEDDEKNNNKFVTNNFVIKRQNISEGGDY